MVGELKCTLNNQQVPQEQVHSSNRNRMGVGQPRTLISLIQSADRRLHKVLYKTAANVHQHPTMHHCLLYRKCRAIIGCMEIHVIEVIARSRSHGSHQIKWRSIFSAGGLKDDRLTYPGPSPFPKQQSVIILVDPRGHF